MNLTSLSIMQAATLIRTGRLSSVELVDAHLDKIAQEDPVLRAYITVTAAQARQAAEAAHREIRAGHYRGPLHGIPVAHKDCFETKGIRTTCGSILLDDYIPTKNAVAVQKLEDAGAILLGKLNMHEWAMSVTNDNPFYGRCRNPHDHSRIPGGSSGGSGAALAAGLCMGSLGTDAGGSVRLPAALCGVVGFKPTFGRISRRGLLPNSFSMDHVGIMARTVEDAALLYETVAGHDTYDPFSTISLTTATETVNALQGVRVAVAYEGFGREGLHPDSEVVAAVEAAVQGLRRLGATITETTLPRMDEANRATFTMIVTEAADVHAERIRHTPDGFSAETLAGLERGRANSGTTYARARKLQAEIARQMEQFFEEYDLLVTPTCPVPAPVHDEPLEAQKARLSLLAYTAPFNLTGLPALSVPCGATRDSLPIGVQFVGARGTDSRILGIGRLFEFAPA